MQITNENNIYFGALKKSQLTKFERVFAETFKPPLEKMNKVEDLHNWSQDCFLRETAMKTDQIGTQNKLDLWLNQILKTLPDIKDNKLWKLIIYKAIQKTDIYYPEFNPKIIKSTIKQITNNIEKTPDKFNFMKIYEKNLRSNTLNKYFQNTNNQNGWIKFTKAKNTKDNEEIIGDIRNLSIGTKWCTKSKLFAEECLNLGDFYILFKDGNPILGIRTQKNKIYEIKNKMNKPEYQTLISDIEELLIQNPQLEKYNDNISIWDMF